VRLAKGVSLQAAQAEVTSLDARLQAGSGGAPGASPMSELRLVPLRTGLFGAYTTYLTLVFVASTLVLLVGCANLASLLLVRARARERRSAIQIALGASTARVIRSALIEAFVLAIAGAGIALATLRASDRAIAAWLPPLFSSYASPVWEPRILVFMVLLVAMSTVVAGVLPGWRAARVDALTVLQRGTGRPGSGRLRGSSTILAVEVACSVVLVACASLATRNLIRLVTTDVGYDAKNLVMVGVGLPASPDPVALRAQYGRVLETLRGLPGVQLATGASVLPISGAVGSLMGDPKAKGYRYEVTDSYVETLGMRLLAGRTMTAPEVSTLAPVGILTESAVPLLWPGERPRDVIGREMRLTGDIPRELVGVVADVRSWYSQTPLPSLYVPSGSQGFRRMDFAARLVPPASLSVADVTRRLTAAGLAPRFAAVSPMEKSLSSSIVNEKFRAELLSGLGVVALVLAAIGLYAVQSFTVTQRVTEFGVRLSLGATPTDLRRLIVRQSLGPAIAGVALGLVGTFWVSRYMQALLNGVDARDPWTYVAVALTLLGVAIGAAAIPARRAAAIDPAMALRAQ
jgi:predicted permease